MLEQPYDRERAATRADAARRPADAEQSTNPEQSAEAQQSAPSRRKTTSAESAAANQPAASDESAASQGSAPSEHSAVSTESASSHDTRLLEKRTETFTGKVVLVNGAYRLALAKEPDTLLRLTRGRRASEFENEQILLRKYYEKIIAVNGTRQDDWIWGADIIGQWVAPGAPTGANMNAPKQARP